MYIRLMKRKFWKIMNKKDINIEEQTDCQNNVTDMNEEVAENAAANAAEQEAGEQEAANAAEETVDSEESGFSGESEGL